MSSNDCAIRVANLSKCYHVYETPTHRLQQFLFPQLDRMLGRDPRAYYKEFWALRDISFEIKKGETVGVVGKNGAGKSTLLQVLTGTVAPTAGSLEIKGRLAALLELGSGFNPEFTGRENVYLNASILGLTQHEIDDKIDAILAFADIGDFVDQPVKTYSSGMFVRLAFAIQANIDPEILIVDEALAVGDAQFVHRCMYRFHQLQQKGTTILFVSHDASAVKRLCSRALWLKGGALMGMGESNTIVDSYLSDLFVSSIPSTAGPTSPNVTLQNRNCIDNKKYADTPPKGDRREGDQSLEIISIGVLSNEGTFLNSIHWGGEFHINTLIKNNAVPRDSLISVGYIIRDPRGIEIASTNTVIEGLIVLAPTIGGEIPVTFAVTLPMLSPGIYSITPSVSVVTAENSFSIRDRIINSALFTVTADGPIFTPLRFPTRVKILS